MLFLYRIYQIFIAIPLLFVATVAAALATILGSMLGFSRTMGYQPGRIWARIFCALTLVRVKVNGRENISKDTSYVFVANHQGAYDIFAIYGFLNHNFRWMMKKGLESIPLVGYSCRVSGHIYVDNSSPSAVRRTMETAEKRLAGGMSVVVFPEGARTTDGRMHPFRRGAYSLAMEFGLPVVPITIDGAYKVMPRSAILPRPGTIRLTIHRPIYAPEGGRHELDSLMKESYAAIASALPEEL
ncbi:MAG: 1-acyl-sn-glycerol-3-phosphate acyltransferase [Muribaculaceae bacterium]|nr:1-acyl-sn-glycerol-3-phosphate acyltransferase [Muribaculaceae bacterium]